MVTLNRAELTKSLRALFGIRGTTNLELSETVIPVANIADMDAPPYHNKRGGTFGLQSGPVAAQLAYVGIRNPAAADANFRAVCRRIFISGAPAGGLICSIKVKNSAALDAVLVGPALNVIKGSWDSTPAIDDRTQMVSYQTTNLTAFGEDGLLLQIPSGTTFAVEGPWVVAPGNTLFVQGATNNIAVVAAFYWDEYYIG